MNDRTNEEEGSFTSRTWGLIGVLFAVAVVVAVIAIWFVVTSMIELTSDNGVPESVDPFNLLMDLGPEGVSLVLALSAGVVGGLIHFITSLTKYAGTRDFRGRWTIWYLARPLLGGLLAVIVYLVFRAGLLPSTADGETFSPYGVAAVSGLAGMFSKQAIDWLERLFNSAFARGEDLPDSLTEDNEEATGQVANGT